MSYAFSEDRTTYVREQLLEDKGDGDALKDISSGFACYFRMWQAHGVGTVVNTTMTIVAITEGDYPDSGGTKSGAEGYITPASAYGRVVCRVVLADTGTVDLTTISGKREFVWKQWEASVEPSPGS